MKLIQVLRKYLSVPLAGQVKLSIFFTSGHYFSWLMSGRQVFMHRVQCVSSTTEKEVVSAITY